MVTMTVGQERFTAAGPQSTVGVSLSRDARSKSRSRSPSGRTKEVASSGTVLRLPATWWSSRVADLVTESVVGFYDQQAVKDHAHNMDHVSLVAQHVKDALMSDENLREVQKAALYLAALLHGVDEEKHRATESKPNARGFLRACLPADWDGATGFIELVVELIDIACALKNQSKAINAGDEWKLIVRDARRAESIGYVGMSRCYAHNLQANQRGDNIPLFCPDTPRARTEDELWEIATQQRFVAFSESVSMIDHYYDELLHFGSCASRNPHLEHLMQDRLKVMISFLLQFGKSGTVDEESLDKLKELHCPWAPQRPCGVDV